MCGVIIAFIVLAAIISAVLHVSAGWGVGIAVALIAGLVIYRLKNPSGTVRTAKMGMMFSNICPACRKHNKSGAVKCRHCGTPLVTQAPAIAQPSTVEPGGSREAQPTKVCPDCAETVLAAARKCRFCGYEFA